MGFYYLKFRFYFITLLGEMVMPDYNMVVLVKQVPDTKNITGEAMKEDGTVNRAALPAVFNPEDLHALEMALQVREQYGGTVSVISMGPPSAIEVLKDALYRGADSVFLISDRAFAGSDTLATSFALKQAIQTKFPDCDIVFCGRQAIDGDTAQVGPGVAEMLDIPHVAYVKRIEGINENNIKVEFFEFKHPVYKQSYPGFVQDMAAIDLLFKTGDKAGNLI